MNEESEKWLEQRDPISAFLACQCGARARLDLHNNLYGFGYLALATRQVETQLIRPLCYARYCACQELPLIIVCYHKRAP